MTAELVAPCRPEELFAWVEDLDRYPRFIGIVARAVRLDGDGEGGSEADAWAVDLRGQLGPLARSKRLRMVRTRHEAPHAVEFRRVELDGRHHSAWTMSADVAEHPEGASVVMALRYDGKLFGPLVERVLRDEIGRSRDRLRTLVAGGAPPA